MTETMIAALDYFEEVSEREKVVLELALDEGECYFINNFNTLQARNGFAD